MRLENRSLTPTLAEVIQTAIDANLIDMHVCLPAKIVMYDSDTQTASVLPSLLKVYEDETVIPWAIIPNVPVVFPRAVSGQAYIHLPLIPGDDVVLLVCERSLDNWKETGSLSEPDDRRQFDITDCFAFPGGSAGELVFSPDDPQAIEVKNLLSMFQLKPTGEIVAQNKLASTTIKSTGEIEAKNSIGSITIKPTGEIEVTNGVATVTISPLGSVSIDAPFVNIGQGASHGVGLGDVIENRLSSLESALATLTSVFGTAHTHISSPTGGPTSPPIPPASPFIPIPIPAASLTVQVST